MANYYYIISEVLFYKHKEDGKIDAFLEGTGIDLSKECKSKNPPLNKILELAKKYNLEYQEDIEPDRIYIYLLASASSFISFIVHKEEYVQKDKHLDMILLGRASNHELVIDFFQFVGKIYGNFLFYCDSGLMSLITPNKDKGIILRELYGEMTWQKELKNIDWSSLKANGFAGDIPQIIENIFSTENHKKEHQYLEELEDYIYHQGTIYEVTAHVLPFLFELLERKKAEIKTRVFFIIAIIYEHGQEQEVGKNIEQKISQNKGKLKFFVDNIADEESQFLCEYIFDSFQDFASMIKA